MENQVLDRLELRMTLDLHRNGNMELSLARMDRGANIEAVLGSAAADVLRRACPDNADEAEVLYEFLCRYLDHLAVSAEHPKERKFVEAVNKAYDEYAASLRSD